MKKKTTIRWQNDDNLCWANRQSNNEGGLNNYVNRLVREDRERSLQMLHGRLAVKQ